MKITELQLQNFKFFTGEDNVLKMPKGENVLIWGENGSGKSSIYWAIYTMLQCSFKDAQGIDDYFTVNHEKNLINIHKPTADPSFVRMSLDNGNEYKIALGDFSIVNDQDIQLSAVSSDFINYQVLASFLSFYHRDDPHLFEMFKNEVFRYLPFSSPAPYTFQFLDVAWEELNKKLVKKGKPSKYPNKQSTTITNKNNLKNAFNIQLKTILGNATTKANEILLTKFGYDIEIELEYREYNFEVLANNSDVRYTKPEIFLKIRKYYGKENAVKKPHSFLNEAKKTAIGLAIRLGILERRLLADKLNVLALDDLLISLDMSNREVVLKLLLDEYQEKYQLLIFTHDKQFFNIAKNKIENNTQKDNWLFWEFYINEKDPLIPKPRFFEDETELSRALYHLAESDYPASVNYLRKHTEKLLEKYLPQHLYANIDKEEPNCNYTLDSMISRAIIFFQKINQPLVVAGLVDLKQYVKILLNPLSHTERGVQRHKGEIKAVIKTLDDLETAFSNAEFKVHLKTGQLVTLSLVKSATVYYEIDVRLLEEMFWFKDGADTKFTLCKSESTQIREFENNALKEDKKFNHYKDLPLVELYHQIAQHNAFQIAIIPNWETLYKKADGTTINTLL
nr:hypothetical protein [uncultured Pedobacter sp.]